MTPDELNAIKAKHKREVLQKIPEDTLRKMIATMAIITHLAWSWVDTVLDLAKLMKLEEVKVISRRLRELQREKERYRSGIVSSKLAAKEAQLADWFQDVFADYIDGLHEALENEISDKHPDGDYNYRMLIQSVYEAMTAIQVVRLYNQHCTAILAEHDIHDYTLIDPNLREVDKLLPEYCGDWWGGLPEVCRTTANILFIKVINFPNTDN